MPHISAPSHKIAAFNSFIYDLTSFPFSEDDFWEKDVTFEHFTLMVSVLMWIPWTGARWSPESLTNTTFSLLRNSRVSGCHFLEIDSLPKFPKLRNFTTSKLVFMDFLLSRNSSVGKKNPSFYLPFSSSPGNWVISIAYTVLAAPRFILGRPFHSFPLGFESTSMRRPLRTPLVFSVCRIRRRMRIIGRNNWR